MEINTASEKVKESRHLAAELLYYRYPTTRVVREIAAKLGVAMWKKGPRMAEIASFVDCAFAPVTKWLVRRLSYSWIEG